MTTDTTFPRPTISQQAAPALLLDALIEQFGDLPAGYLTVHTPFEDLPVSLDMQMDSVHAFEAWRSALEAPADNVELHCTTGAAWLSVRTVYRGVPVYLSGMGLPLAEDQLTAPREVAEVSV